MYISRVAEARWINHREGKRLRSCFFWEDISKRNETHPTGSLHPCSSWQCEV